MAKLIEALALAGSRKTDGTPNASGNVWAYVFGTSTEATIYDDADGTVIAAQPVTLDAAGKATIYVDSPVTLRVETAAGTSLGEIDFQDSAGVVAVENDGFTGTLPDGSQGAGGKTTLDDVLTSALTSFGGTDFQYLVSTGATERTVADRIGEASVSVKDYGATGGGLLSDTVALQTAINRVIVLGGGTVFVPPGTYLTSTLSNSSLIPVSIVGVGPKSILKNSTVGAAVLSFANSGLSGFSIRDLAISSSSTTDAAAIAIAGGTQISVRDVVIVGHTSGVAVSGTASELDFERITATLATGAAPVGVNLSGVYGRVTISKCRITGGTSSIGVKLGTGTATGVGIWGNFIGADICISITPSSSTPLFAIFGNQLAAATQAISSGGGACFQQWGNGVDGVTSTQANNISLTPDWRYGPLFRVNVTGAGKTITLLNPTPTPASNNRGIRMTFRLYNNNAGVTTWATDTAYVLAATIATGTTVTTEMVLEYDVDRGVWAEISRAVHT